MKKYIIMVLASFVLFGCSDDNQGWKTGDKCEIMKMSNLYGTECQGDQMVTCINSHVEVRKCNTTCTVYNNEAMCSESIPLHDGSKTECGSITTEGLCQGNVLKYCNSGKIVETDCTASNMTCGMSRGRYYDCVGGNTQPSGTNNGTAKPVSIPCGNVTNAGICEGNVAKVCIKNSLASVDCSDLGLTCGKGADGNVDCLKSSSGNDNKPSQSQELVNCGNIKSEGACSGNTLRLCVNNAIKTINCDILGLVCGYDTSNKRNSCMKANDKTDASECGNIPQSGTCSGTTLKYCENGQLQTYDCAQRDMICGKTDNSEYACIQKSDNSNTQKDEQCGNVTDFGYCDGDVPVWCDKGKLVRENCQHGCTVDDSGYAVCIIPCDTIDSNGICEGTDLKYCSNGTLVTVDCSKTKCASTDSGYSQCYIPCNSGMKAGDSKCVGNTQVACFEDVGLAEKECEHGCQEGEDKDGKFGVCAN